MSNCVINKSVENIFSTNGTDFTIRCVTSPHLNVADSVLSQVKHQHQQREEERFDHTRRGRGWRENVRTLINALLVILFAIIFLQCRRHFLQEAPDECAGLGPACAPCYILGAVQILTERAVINPSINERWSNCVERKVGIRMQPTLSTTRCTFRHLPANLSDIVICILLRLLLARCSVIGFGRFKW